MADRLSYNMVPNYPSAMLQHHQLPQGIQQGQQGLQIPQQQDQPHPSIQGFQDQSRLWSSMQQQPQFRPQSGEVPQQMADLLRSRATAPGQQQQFGMGTQPQSTFLDQQQQTGSQLLPGFNAAASNMHNSAIAARTAMLLQQQAANVGNPSVTRQLDILLAQNPQPQNGAINFANRIPQVHHQQSPGNQPSLPQTHNELFGVPNLNDAMRRPSPHPQHPPSGMPPNQQLLQNGNREATRQDLMHKVQLLRHSLSQNESQMRTLTASRAAMPDAQFLMKFRAIQQESVQKKELLTKILSVLGVNSNPNAGPNQPQVHPPPPGGQPQWIPQQTIGQSSPFSGTGTMPQMSHTGQQPHMQSSPSQHHPQPSNIPPRNGPTPQQPIPPTSFPSQLSSQPFPFNSPITTMPTGNNAQATSLLPTALKPGMNPTAMQSMLPIVPLEKGRFDQTYKHFCISKNIVHDPRRMSIDNRPIDLHALHTEVLREGGAATVNQNDLWAVIGGRLGFVSFPGSEGEPAKSGPAAAQHLAHVYKEYLAAFDNLYISTSLEKRKAVAQMSQANATPRNMNITSAQMQLISQHLDLSVQELKNKGIPDRMIQFIEAHRAQLLRVRQDKDFFRQGLTIGGSNPVPLQNPGNTQNHSAGDLAPGPAPVAASANSPAPFTTQSTLQASPSGLQDSRLQQQFRPTQEQFQIACEFIKRVKDELMQSYLSQLSPVTVTGEQRMDYNKLIEYLNKFCSDVENRLPMYYFYVDQEQIRKLIQISVTVKYQRELLSGGTPRFIVTLETLRGMMQQIQTTNEMLSNSSQAQRGKSTSLTTTSQVVGNVSAPSITSSRTTPISQQPSPQSQSTPIQNASPPTNTPQLNGRTIPLRPGPAAKKSINAPVSNPPVASPPASIPTPATTVGSPQTPKSPKTKAAVSKKPPARGRRGSKVNTTPANEASGPSGLKRGRDDDPATPTNEAAGPEPSPPKRTKTELEEITRKSIEVDASKTDDAAASFLAGQIAEFNAVSAAERRDPVASNISDTLDLLLRVYSAPPDTMGMFPSGSEFSLLPTESTPPTSSVPLVDVMGQFFDFSSFSDEDSSSKVQTPDLISSSSTNPSPESNTESEGPGNSLGVDVKGEDFADALKLGALKEVDGGESAYYQSNRWNWEGTMHTLETPWAVFTT